MRIVIVAGEISGDILGAGLLQRMISMHPNIEFVGIGGEKMQALGFTSLFPLERLSVMGFVEPLKRLPELLHIRKTLKNYCIDNKVDLFIGIDSPDFNLPIERYVKERGIKSAHYVSPSVWAWRQGRIKGIKKSVDLMLTLLPFEADFYRKHQVPVAFVGHTLADQIAMEPNVVLARKKLGIDNGIPVVALMPGSRGGEVAMLGRLFLEVAHSISQTVSSCHFVLPAANKERLAQILAIKAEFPLLSLQVLDGDSHTAMEASDVVLLASGTTALEAMLLKKPMIVAYKVTRITYWLLSKLVKTPFISLPNLLANRLVVPEIIQDEATCERLVLEVRRLLLEAEAKQYQLDEFYRLHDSIRCNANQKAAQAIETLLCK